MAPSLKDFKVLSFDCYGTLIDWETGIFDQLQELRNRLPASHRYQDKHNIVAHFNKQRTLEAEQPTTPYNQILAQCYASLADEAGLDLTAEEATAFGNRAGEWPAFPDTVTGLQHLKRHCRLVILSNVDNDNMRRTLEGPLSAVNFDGVLTAENLGSYKPDRKNFEALFRFVEKDLQLSLKDHLHVAKSLPVDHVPAKQLGLPSVWIARGDDGNSSMGGRLDEFGDDVAFAWRFASIGDMAKEAERSFSSSS
ncbi:hypothetical protein LTR09_012018 [Extremus antarcticus]|uniref:Haloalkanoic acid dehalogenase n=1 Tax=Extremus antarcticus TaxID=702011 RepID=A0AAJ0D5M6_9PEZI|nr:hypothetical protein LTR09_012018 [Extremus antarcticus]